MAKFHLSKKALDDLSEIWNYTFETWSEKQADKYYKEIIQTFEILSQNPFIGKSYRVIFDGFLGFPCGKHIVFYQVVNSKEILIIRVLHESMDLKNQFTAE